MPERERDENTEAERAVRKITDSERDNGEDLLGSEDLKRQLREAKERESLRHSRLRRPAP